MVQFYLCEIFKQTKLIHSQNLEQWLPLDGYYEELTRKRTSEVDVLYLDKGESISQSSWKCTYIISVFQYTQSLPQKIYTNNNNNKIVLLGQMSLLVNYSRYLKTEIILILHKLLQKTQKARTLPKLSYEISISFKNIRKL